MPRYYFDVAADPLQTQERCRELATVEAAKAHAQRVARELLKGRIDRSGEDMEIVVRDDAGEVFRLKVLTDC